MPSAASGGPGEDVLDLGRRPHVPRWAIVVAGLLAAVLIAAVVVTLGLRSGGSPAPAHTATNNVAATGDAGTQVDSDDVLILGRYLFRLAPDALYRTDASGPPGTPATLPISGLDALGPAESYHLVGDAAARLVWLVGYGRSPASLLAVDTETMAVRARVSVPQTVDGAAALGADLYLVTDNAVIDVPLSGTPVGVPRLTSQYMSIAADRTRHRLVLFDVASRRAVSYDPATRALRGGPKLPIGKGDVLVDSAGHVWAGGYRFSSGGGAWLARLDARTLRPIATIPLADQLGPGAQLVASGSAVIWVRSGAGGDDLWCVDGRSGRAAQHWHLDGEVASRTGVAVVDQAGTVVGLTLRGCRG